ncbi:tetratricopeptide repeat protein 32 isoform X4 [Antechinus flavipes]|uniref:tetratricopeptide repeat protein 32 isoform X4 n=1 Tax=Antechinus flavipes TaxID=38775 RepID=UPI002235955A|nr:tetratricopeptide repeat protein 32 isoform X4 [Antechinus flavipes]
MDGEPPLSGDGALVEAHAHFLRGEHDEAEALYSAYIRQCACADGGTRTAPPSSAPSVCSVAAIDLVPSAPRKRSVEIMLPGGPGHCLQQQGPDQIPSGGLLRSRGRLHSRHRRPAPLRDPLLQPRPDILQDGLTKLWKISRKC